MMEDVCEEGNIFVMMIGNCDVVMFEYMVKMKNDVIVCNIGYFDFEIDVVFFELNVLISKFCIKSDLDEGGFVDCYMFDDGYLIFLLVEG